MADKSNLYTVSLFKIYMALNSSECKIHIFGQRTKGLIENVKRKCDPGSLAMINTGCADHICSPLQIIGCQEHDAIEIQDTFINQTL